MNKTETKAKIAELISSGVAKPEVFARLSGQGVKDKELASLIASYADPRLCAQHYDKVNILLTLMFIQAVIVFLLGFGMGLRIGPNAKWIMGGLLALVPLAFAWGFHRNSAGTYNAYILLSIIQMPRQLGSFASSPIATSIGLAVGIAILAFVWYVRQKLFPDFAFLGPKKIKGQYVFAN